MFAAKRAGRWQSVITAKVFENFRPIWSARRVTRPPRKSFASLTDADLSRAKLDGQQQLDAA
jgi:hypothetical protein